jgi:hypothetical protein
MDTRETKREHQHHHEVIQAKRQPSLKPSAFGKLHFPNKPCHVRAAVKLLSKDRKPLAVKRAKSP